MKERFTTIDVFSVLQDLRERYIYLHNPMHTGILVLKLSLSQDFRLVSMVLYGLAIIIATSGICTLFDVTTLLPAWENCLSIQSAQTELKFFMDIIGKGIALVMTSAVM